MGETTEGIGYRVRQARLLAGLSQRQLADRAHISLSLLKKVEQGAAPASPAFTAAAAKALRMTVYDLNEQPSPRYGSERAGVPELETAVMSGFATCSDRQVRSLAELEPRVTALERLRARARYDAAALAIPELLADLHVSASQASEGMAESERSHHLLSVTYRAASMTLHRLGSPLEGQAAERAAHAACRSGDPVLAAFAMTEIGLPLMHRGAYAASENIAGQARNSLTGHDQTPEWFSVMGAAHLRSAI
ncbi:MAG: helix-turn-helix domain-containing protein, partial [Sciscionella sp.]